jgi:hypothetical protein
MLKLEIRKDGHWPELHGKFPVPKMRLPRPSGVAPAKLLLLSGETGLGLPPGVSKRSALVGMT